METLSELELQPIATNHSSDIYFIDFVIFYKEYIPF